MSNNKEILRGRIVHSLPTLVTIEYNNTTYISLNAGKPEWLGKDCRFTLNTVEEAEILEILEFKKVKNTSLIIKNLQDFSSFQEFIINLIQTIDEHEETLNAQTIDLLMDLKEANNALDDYIDLNSKANYPNCESLHGLILSLTEALDLSKNGINIDYHWGIWRNDDLDILTTGYDNKHFLRSYHLPDTSERRAEYKTPPPNIKWPIIKVNQKNKTFFIGKAPVQEIAQTSYVPHLPPVIQSEDSAARVLDRRRNSNQWQRNADRNRIKKIQDFIEFDNNLITNTPMLYIARQDCITIGENFIEIKFDKFLKSEGNIFVDRSRSGTDSNNNDIYNDYRPFWIIDGQHRIHGINNSNKKVEEIGIIIFDESFDVSQTAKIFAEINTLQQKLPLLHEIFMAHRFKLSHNNPNRTFKDISDTTYNEAKINGWGVEWQNSRANTYSYEIAAMLCSSGVLKGELQFLPQNPSKAYMYSADQWIIYTRKWFTNNGIYGTNHEEKIRDEGNTDYVQFIFREVNHFFEALAFTYRKEKYSDGKSRWSNPRSNKKPLLTKKSNFAILLELYPRIANKARANSNKSSTSPLDKEDFIAALLPISNVDWLNKDINDFYSGGGEKPRRALQAWISDAIANGTRYSNSEIMNEHARSHPGKGIMAPLGKPKVTINKVPSKNNSTIELCVTRPFNARYEGRLTLYNQKGEEVNSKKISHNSELHSSIDISLKLTELQRSENKFSIRIEYFNMHNVVSGYWVKEFEIKS